MARGDSRGGSRRLPEPVGWTLLFQIRSIRLEERRLRVPIRFDQDIGPPGILQEPGESARGLPDLEASDLTVLGCQRLAAHNLDRANQNTSGQCINFNAELGGDPGLFVRLDALQSGVDVDALAILVRPLRAGLNRLRASEDQFCPGLSDAEGSHWYTPSFVVSLVLLGLVIVCLRLEAGSFLGVRFLEGAFVNLEILHSFLLHADRVLDEEVD
jgi:hypothetical protein